MNSETPNPLLEEIRLLLADSSGRGRLGAYLAELHPADVAEILDDLEDVDCDLLVSLLASKDAAEVIDEASDSQKDKIFEELPVEKVADIVETMPPDEAAEALEHLDEVRARAVLQRIDNELAEDIRELREYDSDTAGRIMTTEYLAVQQGCSAGEVLEKVRRHTDEVETLHYILVIDAQERLIGQVEMQDLFSAQPQTGVGKLSDKAVICIHAERDREVAARMMEKYDLAVLPVVGDGGKLLGIITFDDILEVMEEEASEDMYRLAGIGADDPFTEGVFSRAYKRLPWLTTTLAGGAILAVIISCFQTTIIQVMALVSFIPVIAGLGGNVGIQSSTITVRGLATGEIEGLKDAFWLLRREIAVGAIIGVFTAIGLGLATSAFVEWINPQLAVEGGIKDLWRFSALLGVSVFCGIMAATVVGTTVPLLCHHLGKDPAIAAGPFVTVTIDIISESIYLGAATLFLL